MPKPKTEPKASPDKSAKKVDTKALSAKPSDFIKSNDQVRNVLNEKGRVPEFKLTLDKVRKDFINHRNLLIKKAIREELDAKGRPYWNHVLGQISAKQGDVVKAYDQWASVMMELIFLFLSYLEAARISGSLGNTFSDFNDFLKESYKDMVRDTKFDKGLEQIADECKKTDLYEKVAYHLPMVKKFLGAKPPKPAECIQFTMNVDDKGKLQRWALLDGKELNEHNPVLQELFDTALEEWFNDKGYEIEDQIVKKAGVPVGPEQFQKDINIINAKSALEQSFSPQSIKIR